nr:unnamed protein product [Spirometra erinaceieuropaei]
MKAGPNTRCLAGKIGSLKSLALKLVVLNKKAKKEVGDYGTLSVVVPPGCRTKADLVITEDEYDGHFRVETIFEGSVSVLVKDKKDGSVLCPVIINDLTKVLTPQYGFLPVKEVRGAVSYINEGRCFCSYGVAQRVDLTESRIAG